MPDDIRVGYDYRKKLNAKMFTKTTDSHRKYRDYQRITVVVSLLFFVFVGALLGVFMTYFAK